MPVDVWAFSRAREIDPIHQITVQCGKEKLPAKPVVPLDFEEGWFRTASPSGVLNLLGLGERRGSLNLFSGPSAMRVLVVRFGRARDDQCFTKERWFELGLVEQLRDQPSLSSSKTTCHHPSRSP